MLNVEISKKDTSTEIVNSFDMTAAEWLNALDMMDTTKKNFMLIRSAQAFKDASTALMSNISANKSNISA